MKLYTEEQVRKAIDFFLSDETKKDKILETLTPIELPSDEEIEIQSRCYCNKNHDGFIEGSKWMKEYILNKNK